MTLDSEDSGSGATVPPVSNPPEAPMGPTRDDAPPAWWVKLVVWAIVAALCLAFAGLVWALAL